MRILATRIELERHCGWSRARLEAHQRRSSERLRRFAYRRSPFYRKFHAGMERRPFAELPILTKARMMENFDDLVTDRRIRLAEIEEFLHLAGAPLFRNRYLVLATSGSTGLRGIFVFDEGEWIRALASITRPMGWAGVAQNPLRPHRMAMVASTVPWHYSARVSQSLSTPLIPALRLDATEPLETIVRRLNDWQPQILAAYPSLLRQLADEQLAGRLQIALRNVATSAEVLSDETRRRVSLAWGVHVYDTYGATEYAPIAAECAYHRRHLVEDAALIEIVDDRGRPVAPGESGERVLLTVFDRFTQPLIRYEISDMVRPLEGACECGRPFRIIEGIDGRVEDVLYFPARDGSPDRVGVHPNVFHEVFETVPASGWQVLQDGETLRVALAGLSPEVSCERLETTLRQRLEGQAIVVPQLSVERVPALQRGPTGKAPLVSKIQR